MSVNLVVIEGADNVGKTTICSEVAKKLKKANIDTEALSFPGNRERTLGKFIHDFHHNHDKYGIDHISNTSLQLLHVAAHFDTIDKAIKPALQQNKIVLLDRYWWSTYVYGKISGIKCKILDKIMELEQQAWGDLNPDVIFLIDNQKPIDRPKTKDWIKLRNEYLDLADRESNNQHIIQLNNNGSLQDITEKIIGILAPSSKIF